MKLTKIVNGAPRVMARSVDNHLIPTFEFLKRILQSDIRTIAYINGVHSIQIGLHSSCLCHRINEQIEVETEDRCLSEKEFLAGFRTHPLCMKLSEEKIMLGMDLFVHKLGWESAAVFRFPVLLLSYSLKRRLIHRALVMQVLFHKGLAGNRLLSAVPLPYVCAEERFLRNFVDWTHI